MIPIAKKTNLFALACLFLVELSYYRVIISFPRPVSSLTMKAVSDGGGSSSSSSDGGRIQRVVVAGAGVIGISTAYYLAKDFGVATTLIDPTGTIAPAASGKAGGFLAKDWNDHSPAIGPLTRRSFELHQEIADKLGADNIQYRRLTCAAIPVGDNTKNRRPPSGRKLEGIEWANGGNTLGNSQQLGDESTIAQVHPKKLCEAMWEEIKLLTPDSTLVHGKVVSAVYGGEVVVGAQLEDGRIIEGDALLYACGPWTANNMYGTKYHSLVVPTTEKLNQCVFFSGLGDPEVYVRGDSTAYCTGFPDPPIKVTESPGEEEVRQEAIDRIQTSVEMASSYSDDDNAKTNHLIFPPSDGDGDDNQTTPMTTMLKQACYLPSTADGIPMMGRLKENNRPQTFVSAGHTCWGILLGPASGEAMAHEIVTGQSPHIDLSFFAPERFGGPLQLVPSTTPKMTMKSSSSSTNWTPLGVNTFPNVISLEDGCRFAKDEQYLEAVLDLWKQEEGEIQKDKSPPPLVETSPWIYHDDDQSPLYGHIVRPIIDSGNDDDDDDDDNSNALRPGILLFHTAAGPQDVFLFQKAAQLASSELQCIVFICDVLSDPDGWAWSPDGDRTRYNQARKQLLQDNGRLLRSRVNASVRALIGFVDNNDNGNKNNIVVDPNRLAGMGWCMGAQPILELLTLQQQQDEKAESDKSEDLTTQFSVDALISFHGVFRRDPLLLDEEKSPIITTTKNQQRDVLICNGKSDPFVSQNDLEVAKKLMEEKMYKVTVMEFDGAKHGFTNPAQNFNENDAFEYNEYAAKESWKATMELLKRRLL